ncbi:keratin, type I cytoskeletal 9-like [Aethina tumida]|uniref:keratin, type I cytoskeletal 9-like n=1 Tax=Aethina tumida TaxID=116153 RepID=UPI0021479829|nr:keratin, type I cytoskeletal 9-like [Aethina tumida]
MKLLLVALAIVVCAEAAVYQLPSRLVRSVPSTVPPIPKGEAHIVYRIIRNAPLAKAGGSAGATGADVVANSGSQSSSFEGHGVRFSSSSSNSNASSRGGGYHGGSSSAAAESSSNIPDLSLEGEIFVPLSQLTRIARAADPRHHHHGGGSQAAASSNAEAGSFQNPGFPGGGFPNFPSGFPSLPNGGFNEPHGAATGKAGASGSQASANSNSQTQSFTGNGFTGVASSSSSSSSSSGFGGGNAAHANAESAAQS